MKSFIAVFALVAVASARLIPDNSFLPLPGQFDVHPAVDILPISAVDSSAIASSSPLVQIILNIETNEAVSAPVNPSVQPIIQPIIPEVPTGSIVDTVQVAEPIFPGTIVDTVQVAEPIFPGAVVETIQIAEPIFPGTIVDTVQIAEPIFPGAIVDTIQVAQPILPQPIGIMPIPEILN